MQTSRAMVAVVVTLAAGCSFLGVRGPRSGTPDVFPLCTTSRAAPTADVVVGVIGIAALTATAIALRKCESEPPMSDLPCFGEGMGFTLIGAPGGLIGLIDLISAAHGYSRVSKCREAQADAIARGLKPPPPPPPAPEVFPGPYPRRP